MRTLEQLLKHCEASGLTMICAYEDKEEADYEGTSAAEAKDALEACDEMHVWIVDERKKHWGYAFIVNDANGDPEEQIADHSTNDRLDAWMNEGEAA
ncbi:hypothetical protein [Pararhizobium qamdonense]|uniref:hypothetical protein n=1 Tax=Pararhizobium qamdonense TaxID=3031126 RepID=UPI0023E2EB05|nr:hypothetical protein [Pararhizobium qamdonense]